jgi:hypothetical protein
MKIEREQVPGRNTFTGYGPGYVEVNGDAPHVERRGERRARDRLVGASGRDLARADLRRARRDGTGNRPHRHGRLVPFSRAGRPRGPARARVGVEVMDTQAACRTYNILLGEGRNVVAALIV